MTQYARIRSIGFASLLSALLAIAIPAQSSRQGTGTSDSTRENKQAQRSKTADNQPNDPADRELTRKIRQAVVADKSLSTYAHNIKIITQGGSVTLKGPVRTESERTAVEAKAKEIAGAHKVVCQLTISRKGGSDSN